MKRSGSSRLVSWLVMLGALNAYAQSEPFPSVVGGTTVAPQQDVLEFGLGHSDAVSVGWRHGVGPSVELGLFGAATLGYRGLLFAGGGDVTGSALGVRAQGRFKVRLLQSGIVSLGLSFEPGLSWATWKPGSILNAPIIDAFGVELPVRAQLGLALSNRLNLGFRVEVPFFLEFWSRNGGSATLEPPSAFGYAPRIGAGIEFAVSPSVLLYLHARVGLLWLTPIDGQLGLAWRLPS